MKGRISPLYSVVAFGLSVALAALSAASLEEWGPSWQLTHPASILCLVFIGGAIVNALVSSRFGAPLVRLGGHFCRWSCGSRRRVLLIAASMWGGMSVVSVGPLVWWLLKAPWQEAEQCSKYHVGEGAPASLDARDVVLSHIEAAPFWSLRVGAGLVAAVVFLFGLTLRWRATETAGSRGPAGCAEDNRSESDDR